MLCLPPPNVYLHEIAALGGQLSDAHSLLALIVLWLVFDRILSGVSLPAQLRDALLIALVAPFLHLSRVVPPSLVVAPAVRGLQFAPFLHLSRVIAPGVQRVQLVPELRVLPS